MIEHKGDDSVNIQIFGTKKCFDTKKAERYFKERRIKYQLIDINVKGLSKGELRSVITGVKGVKNLINTSSSAYKKSNLANIRGDEAREEILLNNPKLYKTPIVRNGKKATVGYCPDTWKEWE